jgi:hypothetical protein
MAPGGIGRVSKKYTSTFIGVSVATTPAEIYT